MKSLKEHRSYIIIIIFLFSLKAYSADRYWIAVSGANWSSSANWSTTSGGTGGASVPSSGDIAIFNSAKVGNCTLDVSINTAGLDVRTGYSGTIIQSAGSKIIIGSSNAIFTAGTFTGGSDSISVNGSFTLQGSTFASTSGVLIFKGAVINTSGTFTHNNGTVYFSGTVSQTIPAWNFYNITTSSTGARPLASSGTIGIANTFTKGTSNSYTPITGSTVNYNGTSAQTIVALSYQNLTISGARGNNNVTLATSAINIAGSFSASATFTGSAGYVTTSNTIAYNGTGAQTIIAFDYNSLTISGARTTNNITLANSDTIGITGTFTNSSTFTTGAIISSGSTVEYKGSGTQTIIAFPYNNLMSSNSGARTLASTGVIGIAGIFTKGTNTYTNTGSTINYNGSGAQTIISFKYNNLLTSGVHAGNITLSATDTIHVNKMFSPFATFSSGGYVNTGSVIKYSGTLAQTISAFAYNSVVSSSTGERSFTTAGTVSIEGSFTKGTNTYINYGVDGNAISQLYPGISTNLLGSFALNATTAYVSGSGGVILKTTDGGISWTAQISNSSNDLYAIKFFNSNQGIAVGNAGNVVVTTTGGSSWTLYTPTTQPLRNVYYRDSLTVFASGGSGSGVILKSTNGGTSWSSLTVGTQTIYGINFVNADTGYSCGFGGVLYKTVNAGTSWSAKTSGTTEQLTTIKFLNASTGFAVGTNGKIIKTINYGNSWSGISSGTTDVLAAIDFTSSSVGFISGGNITNNTGVFLKTADGGTTWSIIKIASPRITSFSVISSSCIFMSCLDGLAAKYTCCNDGGTVEFKSNSSQSIPAMNYHNLKSSGTGGRTLASSGTTGVSGKFIPGSSNSYIRTGSTIDFNGSYAQSVAATTYNKLIISGIRTIYDVTLDSGIVTVEGNMAVNTTFTSGKIVGTGNTVLFNSTSNQYVNGSTTAEFITLQVNKAGGKLILSQPSTISKQLILTKGIIGATSTNYLQVNNGADTVLGGSDSSYVCGTIRKVGNQVFVFPLGDTVLSTGAYHPLAISAPSNYADVFSGQYFATNQTYGSTIQTDSLESISNCEYWLLTKISGSSTIVPSASWNVNSCNGDNYDLRTCIWNGTQWNSAGFGGVDIYGNRGMVRGATGLVGGVAMPIVIGNAKGANSAYGLLKRELDAGYYIARNGNLRFNFSEEYNDTNGKLSYKLYDNFHNVLINSASLSSSSALQKVSAYGERFYTLNLLSCDASSSGPLGNGYFVLEVQNEKSEKWFMRIKHTVTTTTICH